MKAELITVNSEKANYMLSKNTSNRPINKGYVLQIRHLMQTGQWKERTGDAIRIGKDGRLIDGQHRLSAIIGTNLKVEMLIISELENDIFAVIDQGRKRSAGDVLATSDIPNARNMAAGLRKYNQLLNGSTTFEGIATRSKNSITAKNILDMYYESPESYTNTLKKSDIYYNRFKHIKLPEYFALYHLLRQKKWTNDFFDGITLGELLIRNDPRLVLRNVIIKYSGDDINLVSSTKTLYILKAYYAFAKCKEIKTLIITETDRIELLQKVINL